MVNGELQSSMFNSKWSIHLTLTFNIDDAQSELLHINRGLRFALGKLATEAQPGHQSRLTNPVAKDEISFYLLFLNQNSTV
jgi:hypothetical protein